MTTKTRMNHLLAMAYGNREIATISSRHFNESGIYETLIATCNSEDFPKALRTAELYVSLVPHQACMIRHHVEQAEQTYKGFIRHTLNGPFMTENERCKFILELPDYLLHRLAPCFEFGYLWDTNAQFRKRFNAWESNLLGQLNHIDRALDPGKGKHKRRFASYQSVFLALHPTINELLEEMVRVTSGE